MLWPRPLCRSISSHFVLSKKRWVSRSVVIPYSSSLSPSSSPTYDPDFSSFDWIPEGNGRKVAVALSGGIDSAVTALVMHRKGYQVTGVFMKNWDVSDEQEVTGDEICMTSSPSTELPRRGQCSYSIDLHDAKAVASRMNVPLIEVDFVKDYWNQVFTPFIDDYQSGNKTPNPDVFCNRFIKFDKFLKHVRSKLSIDIVAFGHYANLVFPGELRHDETTTTTTNVYEDAGTCDFVQTSVNERNPYLQRAMDSNKDQTYFLW